MSPKFIKYKLLLDENLPPREKLHRLNNRYDLKHITHDYHKQGVSDQKVYELACKEERIIVTFNESDFYQFSKKKITKTGILALSANLSTEQIDKKMTALLQKSKRTQVFGQFNKIVADTNR